MWESRAVWPSEVSAGNTDNESRDSHTTEKQAQSVCDALKREGLGGEGIIFPISTCVVEIKECRKK